MVLHKNSYFRALNTLRKQLLCSCLRPPINFMYSTKMHCAYFVIFFWSKCYSVVSSAATQRHTTLPHSASLSSRPCTHAKKYTYIAIESTSTCACMIEHVL